MSIVNPSDGWYVYGADEFTDRSRPGFVLFVFQLFWAYCNESVYLYWFFFCACITLMDAYFLCIRLHCSRWVYFHRVSAVHFYFSGQLQFSLDFLLPSSVWVDFCCHGFICGSLNVAPSVTISPLRTWFVLHCLNFNYILFLLIILECVLLLCLEVPVMIRVSLC